MKTDHISYKLILGTWFHLTFFLLCMCVCYMYVSSLILKISVACKTGSADSKVKIFLIFGSIYV